MQIFIVSPIFLYLLVKFGRKCFYMFGAITIASGASIFVIIHLYDFNWMSSISDRFFEFDILIFHETQHRVGPWVIGMYLGYYVYEMRDKPLPWSKVRATSLTYHSFCSFQDLLYFYSSSPDHNQNPLDTQHNCHAGCSLVHLAVLLDKQ